MASYLNPQENFKEFGLSSENLFSSWQPFDEKLVNAFITEVKTRIIEIILQRKLNPQKILILLLFQYYRNIMIRYFYTI